MRFPALARIFSLVLAILCLTMLLAGLGSIGAAMKERSKGLAEHDRLTEKIEDYRQVSQTLQGSAGYEAANQTLAEEQQKHDEEASQHRMDLAVYTATRGGLKTGEDAMAEAESTFLEGKAQYEAGLKELEDQESAFWSGYFQFQEGKQQLAAGRQQLELTESTLGGVRSQLQASRNMASLLDSDDENARQALTVAAYDSVLASLDGAVSVYEQVKAQGGISPEQMQMLATLLAEQTGVDASQFLGNVTWQGISADAMQDMENQVQASTGMSVADIRSVIQQRRDEAAAMDAGSPISEEQFEAMKAIYSQNKGLADMVFTAMDSKLGQYEAELASKRAELDAAQAQIDAMEPVFELGKTALEQAHETLDLAGEQIQEGEKSLAEGRAQLEKEQAELKKKEEALRKEKIELDQQAAELTEKSTEVTSLKELERRETSLRVSLLDRQEIQERTKQGMELLPAADLAAEELLRQVEGNYVGRVWIGALLIGGALAGFIGIPAAFEKTKRRFWLIAPVLLCLGLALAAEILCRALGRGDSYSALAAAAFALIQLILIIPKKKKA